jgi:hypothetical protein
MAVKVQSFTRKQGAKTVKVKGFRRKGHAAKAITTTKRRKGLRFKPATKGKAFKPMKAKRRTARGQRAVTARKFVKKPVRKTTATSSHTRAGLHRMGKTGNRYSDSSGKVFKRVGKGKKARFAAAGPAPVKRSKGRKRPTRPIASTKGGKRRTTQRKGRSQPMKRVRRKTSRK